jgi:hypothetical protein
MSKKVLLLALAVAAMFAFPTAASAEEIHFDNVTTFSGHGPKLTYVAEGEPKYECTASALTGSYDSGSTTTGKMNITLTGCEAEFLFFRVGCNTSGAASKTIVTSGTFHLITFVNPKAEKRPAILLTLATPEIICAGFANTTLHGSIIGTITSPACNGESTSMGISFNSNNTSTQEHMTYTGVKYDLMSQTSGEPAVTFGLTATMTFTSTTKGKLTCT